MENHCSRFYQLSVRLLFLAASCFAIHQSAEAAETENIDVFVQPVEKDIVRANYPTAALSRSSEGLVKINFMVDVDGNVFEPVVTSSMGHKSFEREALRALSKSTFEPAKLDGEPVVGSSTYLYRFVLEKESEEARPSFGGRYRKVQKALEKEDQERALEELQKLRDSGAENHYENAFLYFAEFSYEQKFGTDKLMQMELLHGALSFSDEMDDPVYWNEEMVAAMRGMLFTLQVQNRYFYEALLTYNLLKETGETEAVDRYAAAVSKIMELRESDAEYSLDLTVGDDGYTTMHMFKRNFYLTGGQGAVSEVRLRCEKNFISFLVERDIRYSVGGSSGDCNIEFIGDVDAQFTFVQL